jgi:DNA-binding MarR family transcriptional regulator
MSADAGDRVPPRDAPDPASTGVAGDPARVPGPFETDGTLILWELVQTAHLAARVFRDTFAAFGLTPTQFGVLSHLANGDDLTKAQLARAVLVSPQSMDPLIEGLLTAGYVERDGIAKRGRAAAIRITDAGLTHLSTVRPAVGELNQPERLDLDPADVPLLMRQLQTIRARLQH